MKELDFRDFILAEFSRRTKSNPNYSMRAFARDLGTSHQSLSHWMNGRAGISPGTAFKLSTKLNLNPQEKDLFVTIVTSKFHRSQSVRALALNKLNEHFENNLNDVSTEEMKELLDWYAQPIYYLVETEDFKHSVADVAKKMAIRKDQAEKVVALLMKLGFLKVNSRGRWQREKGNLNLFFAASSPMIQKYYTDSLKKALETLSTTPEPLRRFSLSYLLINEDDIPFIAKELDHFRKRLIKKLSEMSSTSERIYGLGMQLFPFDQRENR